MQSRKPIAKEFKKEVKQILKTIRKTGGYINNSDLMIDTYFGDCDETHKGLVRGLLQNIENQQKRIKELTDEVIYKEDVIVGLVDDITIAEKRQVLNRVVRHNTKNYRERWIELYTQFQMKYHCNLTARMDAYNQSNTPKMRNKLDYVDKVMNKVPELYEIACKLYQNDINELLKEMYGIQIGDNGIMGGMKKPLM